MRITTKKVLLGVHAGRFREGAVSYALELASRMNLSLVLMLVGSGESSPKGQAAVERLWIERVVKQCQEHGVSVELFIGTGPLCEEVLRFVGTDAATEFVVMDLSDVAAAPDSVEDPTVALQRLGEEFEGEVLLVPSRGAILRLKDVSCKDILKRR